MSYNSENANRIAKNAIFLYIRTFIILIIGLYTSRLILNIIGIEDYGIYNVVGGVVMMLSVINMSLSNASSRFITIAIGSKDKERLRQTFNSVVTIHFIFAGVLLLFAETFVLWFVEYKLNIPDVRKNAAFWVFQGAVVSSLIMILSVPFNALIIAYERMNVFAYISIVEAILKLLIIYVVDLLDMDKLISYAVFLVVVQVFMRLMYTFYCRKHFVESKYRLSWNTELSKEIFSFAGWTLNGNIAVVGYTQGLNVLLNIYFGPAVNAARGISVQVQSAMKNFYQNFQTAINPQIIKSYSQKDFKYMHELILTSSRISFYLMLIISLPIMVSVEYILDLWLSIVPDYTIQFVRIMILVTLINTLSNPIIVSIHATGNIKKFQMIEGSLLLSIVPVSYLLLKYYNVLPTTVFIVYLVIEFITQIIRVIIVCPKIHLLLIDYVKSVCIRITLVSLFSSIIPIICNTIFIVDDFMSFCIMTIICVLSTLFIVLFVGVNKIERIFIWKKIHIILNKLC